jgi:transcription antitermination factor NusB
MLRRLQAGGWGAEDRALRKRTRARELAIQALYQLDLLGAEVLEQLDQVLARSEAEPEARRFARELILGTWTHRQRLDAQIAGAAEHWDLHRMAVVDRNILRLASYELLYLDDVPPKVAINEAIDLAKRLSTADSGAFVNGILDRIRIEEEKKKAITDSTASSDEDKKEGTGEEVPGNDRV